MCVTHSLRDNLIETHEYSASLESLWMILQADSLSFTFETGDIPYNPSFCRCNTVVVAQYRLGIHET